MRDLLPPPLWPVPDVDTRSDGNDPRAAESCPASAPFGAVDRAVVKESAFGGADWWRTDWWPLPAAQPAPDVLSQVGTVGDCAVAAASVRGHHHRYDGTPNQDAFALRWSQGDGGPVLIAVVCDGMSSAKHSAVGSRRVADRLADGLSGVASAILTAGESAASDLVSDLLERIVDDVARSCADVSGLARHDLETTATFVVLSAVRGARHLSIGAVGDSPALALRRERWELITQGAPSDGDVHTSTSAGAFSTPRVLVQTGQLKDDVAVLICSDGIGNFLGTDREPLQLGALLATAWSTPVDPVTFVNQLSFDLPSADDDRTAVMIWPLDGTA